MLLKIIRRMMPRGALTRRLVGTRKKKELLALAASKMVQGSPREAILAIEKFLKIDPLNVQAINDLGVCLADIGRMEDAHKYFELAYSLDYS
jgi:Flp pilus assembly protein TadD